MDNLAMSDVTPRAVSGSLLHPVGKLPNVHFNVNGRDTHNDVHIYPSVLGAVMSWLTAKHLGILQESYPQPAPVLCRLKVSVTAEQLMEEFPTIFNGQICTMPGEKFHISLMDNARPFCVISPYTVPPSL